jgi:sterol desaturase/sphingolipid hydroxylase (fatty acid hydroxylase superfamily)
MNMTFYISLLWLAISKPIFIFIMSSSLKNKNISSSKLYKVDIEAAQKNREAKSVWLLLTDPILLFLFNYFSFINLSKNSALNTILTFFVFFAWVEVWFYFSHRFLHGKIAWKIHEHHHLSIIIRPLSSSSFSFTEKFFFYTLPWISFVSLISWFMPISLSGVLFFYTFYFIISPMSHSKHDFFSSYLLSILPFNIGKYLASPASHAVHHNNYNVNFGFFSLTF